MSCLKENVPVAVRSTSPNKMSWDQICTFPGTAQESYVRGVQDDAHYIAASVLSELALHTDLPCSSSLTHGHRKRERSVTPTIMSSDSELQSEVRAQLIFPAGRPLVHRHSQALRQDTTRITRSLIENKTHDISDSRDSKAVATVLADPFMATSFMLQECNRLPIEPLTRQHTRTPSGGQDGARKRLCGQEAAFCSQPVSSGFPGSWTRDVL